MRKQLLPIGFLFSCLATTPLSAAVSFDQVMQEQQRASRPATAVEMPPAALVEHVMTTGKVPSSPVVVPNPLVEDGVILVVPMGIQLDAALESAFGWDYRSTRGYQCLGPRALDLPEPNTPTQAHVLTDDAGLRMGEPYLHVIEFNSQDSADHAMSVLYDGFDLASGDHFKRFMPVFLLMHEWYHTGTFDLRDCKEATPLDMRFVSEVGADVFAAIMTGRVMETQKIPAHEIQAFFNDLVQWRTQSARAACGHNALTHLSQPALLSVASAWGDESSLLFEKARGMRNTETVAVEIAHQLYRLLATDEALLSKDAITDMVELLRLPGVNFDQQIDWLWQMNFSRRQSPMVVKLLQDYIAEPSRFGGMSNADAQLYVDELVLMRGSDGSRWAATVTPSLEGLMQMPSDKLMHIFMDLSSRIDWSDSQLDVEEISAFMTSLRPVSQRSQAL